MDTVRNPLSHVREEDAQKAKWAPYVSKNSGGVVITTCYLSFTVISSVFVLSLFRPSTRIQEAWYGLAEEGARPSAGLGTPEVDQNHKAAVAPDK